MSVRSLFMGPTRRSGHQSKSRTRGRIDIHTLRHAPLISTCIHSYWIRAWKSPQWKSRLSQKRNRPIPCHMTHDDLFYCTPWEQLDGRFWLYVSAVSLWSTYFVRLLATHVWFVFMRAVRQDKTLRDAVCSDILSVAPAAALEVYIYTDTIYNSILFDIGNLIWLLLQCLMFFFESYASHCL